MGNSRAYSHRGLSLQGGTPVPPGEFLDCVVVGSDTQWACSGTLVAPNVVITLAYCAEVTKRVFFGHSVHSPGKIVKVKETLRHPKYADQAKYDLLVLLLRQPVDAIAPRGIAPGDLIDRATDARFVGFGSQHEGTLGFGVKRFVDMPIISPACGGKIGGQSESKVYGCKRGMELVAGDPVRKRDSGRGDGGAPLYIQDARGEWLVAGATSRALDTATQLSGEGGIYTRVDRYREWIGTIPGVQLPK